MIATRSQTISTKVTAEEKVWCEKQAFAEGLSSSEWIRNTLLRTPEQPVALKLMIAEVRAMRSILLSLVTAALTGVVLTDEQIKQIVAHAEATKYQRAEESFESLLAALAQPPPKGTEEPTHELQTTDGTADPG